MRYREDLLSLAVSRRRMQLFRMCVKSYGLKVQSGPFEGMALSPRVSWGDGDLLSKLIGSYEAELHSVVAEVIRMRYKRIVNVGCAEGYYAVGFATKMPTCEVVAFDSSKLARSICERAASLNLVQNRVTVLNQCSISALEQQLCHPDPVFLFVDCEGDELHLLSPAAIPRLRMTDMVIECHNFIREGTTTAICDRFSSSHQIRWIYEESRMLSDFPILKNMSSLDRAIASCEFRPAGINWLYCRSTT